MRRRLAVLLCCGLAAAGWEEARERFQRAYRADSGAAQRKAALLELAKADVPEAAELLFGVYDRVGGDARKLRGELHRVRGRIRAARAKLRGVRDARQQEALAAELEEWNAQDGELNARLAGAEIEQAAVLDGVRALRAAPTLAWLADRGLARAGEGALLNAAAEAIAAGGDVGPLLTALDRLKRPEQIVALLQALEGKAAAIGPGLAAVLRQLAHRDWSVRVAAAFVVARAAQPEGVGALVQLVQKEAKGSRAQHEVGRALQLLTGEKFGPDPEVWAAWWRDHEAEVLGGKVLLGQGRPQVEKADQGHFYGIPQVARRIVYVLDQSGSMEVSMEHPRFVDGGAVAARDDEDSRFDVALRELLRATRSLAVDASYAVILYSDHASLLLEDELFGATKENHARLEQALARVGPEGTTNIYEAMDLALRVANVHPDSKGPSKADAIYLISDGSPTDAKGNVEDPDRTLAAVRSWNALRRVAVHTIGIGREHNSPFLKRLADENGGEYHAVLPK